MRKPQSAATKQEKQRTQIEKKKSRMHKKAKANPKTKENKMPKRYKSGNKCSQQAVKGEKGART